MGQAHQYINFKIDNMTHTTLGPPVMDKPLALNRQESGVYTGTIIFMQSSPGQESGYVYRDFFVVVKRKDNDSEYNVAVEEKATGRKRRLPRAGWNHADVKTAIKNTVIEYLLWG